MQLQRLIGRGSSVVRARNPTPTPLRTFRETPYYLSCRVRFLPPYLPWTFAIIIFYSHVSCSLDSERYLLQTPLAFFFHPSSSYTVTFYFSFAQVVLQCWAFPGQGWIYSPHLPGCGLSWVYCICLSWSVICKAPLKTLPLPPTAL